MSSVITRTTTTVTTKITRYPSPNAVIIKQQPPAWEQLEFEFDSVS